MKINPYEGARFNHALLSGAEQVTLNLATMKQEFSNSLTIPFQDLLKKTHPQAPPEVINGILAIMSTLRFFMTYDLSEGSSMYLRGGTMRKLLRKNNQYDQLTTKLWKNIILNETRDPFTYEVLEHAFGPKDIDVVLNYGNVIVKGEEVIRPFDEDLIDMNIALALEKMGWEYKDNNLRFGDYLAQISSFPIDRTSKRLLHKVLFSQKTDQSPVLEISFADRPRTETELEEDIRFFNDGFSIDAMAVGYVEVDERNKNIYPKPVTVTYEKGILDYDLSLRLLLLYSQNGGLFDLTKFNDDYVKAVIEGFRTIDMMLGDPVAWSIHFGFKTLQENLDYWREVLIPNPTTMKKRRQNIRLLKTSVRQQLPYIKEKAVPLLSDILFSLTTEPYLGLMLVYFTGMMETINLGEIVNSEERLIKFMGNVACPSPEGGALKQSLVGLTARHHVNSDPLVILDALKQFEFLDEEKQHLSSIGLYPEQIPRSVSSLLRFLVPRGLSLKDLA